ncbi:translational activator hypothetical protein [Limosa lapponica baueri]|uniref:TOG domain-containing protein n=4 Tax=cellular organisms TaxID=131567 RepID=A0A2I0TXW8_LIMLA|nr:translational activator hypothetical protein [Limosa lapponica baueri]
MPREDRATWKSNYFMKIIQLLDDYPKCFIVGADNVGSKQMQQIRMSLRGKAVVLMGKNTMMRKAIRGHLENNPALEKLLPHIRGNVGFVFTKEDLTEIRDMLLANKVPAAARAGAIAPCDVTVPAQNTGLGPEKTSFFQALGITTKISRGTIEILSDVQLIKTGDKVGASEATLLNMLNISPFSFGLVIQQVFDNGSIYNPEVLDITEETLHKRFLEGVRNVASISDTLKRFAVKVTTASVKERREILSELGKCISGKGGVLTWAKMSLSALLDFYLKTILMSKTKPQKHVLDSCSPLLRYVSHAEFKDLILPTLQKSLLRSPENVIETISCLLVSVNLDLSQYALDIVKGLASHLKSNSAQLMDEAVVALKNLARQCSDPSAVESLGRHLFAILGGSEGKLTVVAQKMSVLSAMCTVLQLTERLLLDHAQRLPESKVQQYHRALVAVLLSRIWHVRRQAHQTVKKLLSSLGGYKLAYGLLEELKVVLSSHKVLPHEVLVMESGELSELGKTYVPPRVLLEALCVISSVAGLDVDSVEPEKLALEMLLVSHHPSVVAVQPGLWPALLIKMKIDPKDFITKHLNDILPRITAYTPENQSSMNAVGSLSLLSPGRVLPQLISTISASMENPALCQVTREEFAIMKTPEGELYDKSIIQSAQQDSMKKANMKRENKAYSFKEQIIELELKEEIKKKKGIKDEVQLTSKQKELMHAQLERESQIRKRLKELDNELETALGLLDTVIKRKPPGLSQYIPGLISSFLPLLRSPLAAPRVKEPFLSLASCVMPARLKTFGTLVSHVTLRLMKPECELDESWCQEELPTALNRVVSLLHAHTIPSRTGKGEPGAAPLSAPAFSLVFPLLKTVMTETPHDSEEKEEFLVKILQILTRPPPVLDALGRVISESPPDQWEARCGIALALNKLSQHLDSSQVKPLFQFFVPDALNDRSPEVRKCMLDAALSTLNTHGKDNVNSLLPVFEEFLKNAPNDASYDAVRQSVVILMGSLAKHLDKSDPKVKPIVGKLIAALSTPSQQVQESVASCLPPLVPAIKEDAGGMIQKLMQLLLESDKYAERKGAAYGLAGLVKGLGILSLKQQEMMTTLTDAIQDKKNFRRREGALFAFEMLCSMLGKLFEPYVVHVLPHLLLCFGDGNQYVREALADENEFVRDTALRAGQRIISMYAETAIALLLPQLEDGLFDDLWRIRFSSVQLLGDLLFHISGVTGKMTTETASEDDNFGTAQSNKAIINALGVERRNRVLAGLYMGRSDTQLVVRQASLHVWKIVVSNTPRTLREILPTLFGLLLKFLASTCADKRTVAARTLGDLVRKLGEKILPEIIPILEDGLRSDKSDERQGVCIGLSEIMKSTSRDAVLLFSESLVPTVRKALCDPLEEVREAAAKTFEQLHSTIGHQALEDILPFLLKQLDNEETSDFAVDGLKQVMAVKSRVVLPYLVPKLTTPPVNTRVLAFLSAVAGDALTRHLSVILPAMMSALKEKLGTSEEQLASSSAQLFVMTGCLKIVLREMANCQSVILSVEDDAGQRIITEDLLEATRSPELGMRQAAAVMLNIYCSKTKADYTGHLKSLVSGLIRLFNDTNPVVLNESWDALNAITKKLDAGNQLALIEDLHKDIRIVGNEAKGEHVPGFCIPKKGVTSILLVLREGVLTGNPEQKEEAAKALGLVIKLTSAEALKPSVVSITGPLIRILGDRFSWNVKVALLETLSLLLAKLKRNGQQQSRYCPGLSFAADVSGIDWMVRHGRSLALSVAVNVAPSRLCSPKYYGSVQEMILSNATADRIPIAVSGIRGMGFLMKYHMEGGENLPPKLSNLFIKCLQNSSSDIKLVAEKMIWWANKNHLPSLDPQTIKPILKALLDNTKDKNTSVRAYSDQAIVNLLKMRAGEEVLESVSKILDGASLELLNESCRRSLKKLAGQADSEEQIDDTILT